MLNHSIYLEGMQYNVTTSHGIFEQRSCKCKCRELYSWYATVCTLYDLELNPQII